MTLSAVERVQSTLVASPLMTWSDGEAGGRQRHTGVRGHGTDGADPGHDLERDPGLPAGQRFFGQTVEHGRVTVHEPDNEPVAVDGASRLGRLDEQLRARRVRQRLTLLAVAGINDLDVGAGMTGHEVLAAYLVDDDHVGLCEVLRGAEGQQAGVARTGADKGNPSGLTDGLAGLSARLTGL